MNIDPTVISELMNAVNKTVTDHVLVRRTKILEQAPDAGIYAEEVAILEAKLALEGVVFALMQKAMRNSFMKGMMYSTKDSPSIHEKVAVLWKDYLDYLEEETDDKKDIQRKTKGKK